ncbi:7-cyano-7-deazaguanine synthase QueC [Patescibacteria group bacterium]|nr:7-cyano-7-deazaguanine synthase QueC [Patescibacteria group bacterium]
MSNKKDIAICLFSGGLDSAVAVAVARDRGYEPSLLFVNYGQKTQKKERWCVKKIAEFYNIKKIQIVDIMWLKDFGKSALFDKNIKLDENNKTLEYVPFRNSIFLSIATAWAEVENARAIFVGSSGGDSICPDNSSDYLKAFQQVINIGTMLNKNIKIIAPLINTNKNGAVKIGKKLNVRFDLTWSCHNNLNKACGHCSNCLARRKAFGSNGLKDPILYE